MTYYRAQTVFNQNDIMHYGVKGMRWGTRRGNLVTRGVNGAANSLGTGGMLGRAVNQWAGRRYVAEQHNANIKNNYNDARKAYKQAKMGGNANKIASTKAAYKTARNARARNLASRAALFSVGYTKSHQGRYYMNRASGQGKFGAGANTVGHVFSKNVLNGLAPGLGHAKTLYDAKDKNSADYVRSEKFRKRKW